MSNFNEEYSGRLQWALDVIRADYGVDVSIEQKLKGLNKFGQTLTAGTAASTLAIMPTGETEETFVRRNLITHYSSSSASDTVDVVIEGHTVGADVSVSSITQSGGTATCTTSAAHGVTTGDWVYIEGAGEAGYNGVVQVASVVSPIVFTYTVDSGTASPATGTITVTDQAMTFVEQRVTLDGQTKTALDTPLARISKLYVPAQNRAADLAGSVAVYEDDTVTAGVPDTAAKTHLLTRAGKNYSEKGQTTLSALDYLLVTSLSGEVLKKSAGFADVRLEQRRIGGVWRETGNRLAISAGSGQQQMLNPVDIVPANADVRLQTVADASNTQVGGNIGGYLATVLPDPATARYMAAAGVTAGAVRKIDRLMRYLRSQGLSANSVLYPMTSTYGGTDATAYPCGDLTSNEVTWVASPTVDATGTTLNGTSQYGSIPDFMPGGDLFLCMSFNHTAAASSTQEYLLSQRSDDDNQSSFFIRRRGDVVNDPYDFTISSTGSTGASETYSTDGADSNSDLPRILAYQWENGGSRAVWINNVSKTLTLTGGSNRTSRFDANSPIGVGVNDPDSPSVYAPIRYRAILLINGVPNTTQREAIKDLMNAL